MVLSREDVLPAHLFELSAASELRSNQGSRNRLSEAAIAFMKDAMASSAGSATTYGDAVACVEEALIRHALLQTGGNQLRAAQVLGMHRSTLRKKVVDCRIVMP